MRLHPDEQALEPAPPDSRLPRQVRGAACFNSLGLHSRAGKQRDSPWHMPTTSDDSGRIGPASSKDFGRKACVFSRGERTALPHDGVWGDASKRELARHDVGLDETPPPAASTHDNDGSRIMALKIRAPASLDPPRESTRSEAAVVVKAHATPEDYDRQRRPSHEE